MIRLAAMEKDEFLSRTRNHRRKRDSFQSLPVQESQPVHIIDGEEDDVMAEIPCMTSWFDEEMVCKLKESENAHFLLAPAMENRRRLEKVRRYHLILQAKVVRKHGGNGGSCV